MSSSRFPFFAAVYLITLDDEGRVLLARRCNTGWMDAQYSLPAGHMDGGETAHEAMAREAKEETNLDIAPGDLRVIHVMHRRSGDREYFDVFLRAEKWSGTLQNTEPEKCDHLGWFHVDNLPENTLDFISAVLRQKEKGFFSSWGFSQSLEQ